MNESLQAEQCIYFGHGFTESDCVRTVVKEFGPKGYAILNALLIFIEKRGIGLSYNKSFRKEVCECLYDISENLVDMVVQRMLKFGFLDYKMFNKHHVLTPPSDYVCSSNEFVANSIRNKPFVFVIFDNSLYNRVISEITNVSSEETRVNSEETTINSKEKRVIAIKNRINSDLLDNNVGITEIN